MDARVIFTNKFKKVATTPISRKKQAELRWNRLVEAEESGELQMIKSRVQLGNLVGITNGSGARSYVVRLVNKGVLEERLVSKVGVVPEYEYHLKQVNDPFKQTKKVEREQPTPTTTTTTTTTEDSKSYAIKVEYSWGKVSIESRDADGLIKIINALK